MRARCGCCGRRRDCWPISRKGGGTYRRGGRLYRGWICAECVTELLTYATPTSISVSRYSVLSLRRLAAHIEERTRIAAEPPLSNT